MSTERQPSCDPDVDYFVEKILDYKLDKYAQQDPSGPDYDPTLGAKSWQVRFLIKWDGFDESYNSWEPRSNFGEWTSENDEWVTELRRKDLSKKSIQELEEKAKERNNADRIAKQAAKGKKRKGDSTKSNFKQEKKVKQEVPKREQVKQEDAVGASISGLIPSLQKETSRSRSSTPAQSLATPAETRGQKRHRNDFVGFSPAGVSPVPPALTSASSSRPSPLAGPAFIDLGFADDDSDEDADKSITAPPTAVETEAEPMFVDHDNDCIDIGSRSGLGQPPVLLAAQRLQFDPDKFSPFADDSDEEDQLAPPRTNAQPQSSRSSKPAPPAQNTLAQAAAEAEPKARRNAAEAKVRREANEAEKVSREAAEKALANAEDLKKEAATEAQQQAVTPLETSGVTAAAKADVPKESKSGAESDKPKPVDDRDKSRRATATGGNEGSPSTSSSDEVEALLSNASAANRTGTAVNNTASASSPVADARTSTLKDETTAKPSEGARTNTLKNETTAKSNGANTRLKPAKRKRISNAIVDSEDDDSTPSTQLNGNATGREDTSAAAKIKSLGPIPKKRKPDPTVAPPAASSASAAFSSNSTTTDVPGTANVNVAAASTANQPVALAQKQTSPDRESPVDSDRHSRTVEPQLSPRRRRSESPVPQTPFEIKQDTHSEHHFDTSPDNVTSARGPVTINGERRASGANAIPLPPRNVPTADPRLSLRNGGTSEASQTPAAAFATEGGSSVRPLLSRPNEDARNKPVLSNGFIDLRTEVLEQQLRKAGFLREIGGNGRETPVQSVRRAFGVGDWYQNYADFDGVMSRGPDGLARQCWIYAPKKDIKLQKQARLIEGDYIALQLLLSSIPGVKQADSLRESVTAVFVHASEAANIGKDRQGPLAQLDSFRSRTPKHTVFIIFGEWDDGIQRTKRRLFRRFWAYAAAITFTPQAFIDSPLRIENLLKKVATIKTAHRHWSVSAWVPCSYAFPNGPFASDTKFLWALFWSLVRESRLSLFNTLRVPHGGVEWPLVFPHRFANVVPVKNVLDRMSEDFPRALPTDMTSYLSSLAHGHNSFLNFRQWIVIRAVNEKDTEPLPGVEVMTIQQAEAWANRPDMAG
ncbi:hypothetical protein ACM66B_005798 [Microbotryomycetes sp. NB124-2]